jgi:hypothetical protein
MNHRLEACATFYPFFKLTLGNEKMHGGQCPPYREIAGANPWPLLKADGWEL